METETQTKLEMGTEVSLDELDKELDMQKKESQKTSRFRQIESGKTATLTFTGKVAKRTATGTDSATGTGYSADKFDFELVELVTEGDNAGKNRVFSVGARNKVVREIAANIKAGRKTMLISRKGEGKATKYEVTTPE